MNDHFLVHHKLFYVNDIWHVHWIKTTHLVLFNIAMLPSLQTIINSSPNERKISETWGLVPRRRASSKSSESSRMSVPLSYTRPKDFPIPSMKTSTMKWSVIKKTIQLKSFIENVKISISYNTMLDLPKRYSQNLFGKWESLASVFLEIYWRHVCWA